MEPKFNVRPKINGSVNIGELLAIKCEVEADPEPELVWIIGNKEEFYLAIYRLETMNREKLEFRRFANRLRPTNYLRRKKKNTRLNTLSRSPPSRQRKKAKRR